MLVKLLTAAVKGLQATIVQVEVHAVKGDKFYLVGLPDSSIRESHDRMIAAIQNSGYHYSTQSYTINLAPADLRKEGTGYDLPLAIGVMASSGSRCHRTGMERPWCPCLCFGRHASSYVLDGAESLRIH